MGQPEQAEAGILARSPLVRGLRRWWRLLFVLALTLLALAAGTWEAWNLACGHELAQTEARLRASGHAVTMAEVMPAALPDAENAAVLYAPLLARIKDPPDAATVRPLLDVLTNLPDYTDPQRWTQEQREQMTALYQSPLMQEVKQQAPALFARPRCQFLAPFPYGTNPLMPQLSTVARLDRLLLLQATGDAAVGQPEAATAALLAALQVAQHAGQDVTFVNWALMTREDMEVCKCLRRLAAATPLSPAQARAFQPILQAAAAADRVPQVLAAERAFWHDNFVQQYVRDGGSLHFLLDSQDEDPPAPWLDHARTVLLRPWFKHTLADYLDRMGHIEDRARLPYAPNAFAAYIPPAKPVPYPRTLAHRYLALYATALRRNAVHQAELTVTSVGLAVQVYHTEQGKYPATLAALLPTYLPSLPPDPCTGQPLHYALAEDGGTFMLYSVGPNQADDHGYSNGDNPYSSFDDVTWVARQRPKPTDGEEGSARPGSAADIMRRLFGGKK